MWRSPGSGAAVDRQVVVIAVPLAIEQYGEYVRQVAGFAERQVTEET